jgi:putative glutamine amidotransferase
MNACKPLVAVNACVRTQGAHPFHMAGEKYLRGVIDGADALPLMVPALSELIDPDELLERIDGLLLTGSPSNIEPHHYGGTPGSADTLLDPQRDAFNLPLIRRALALDVPLLAICRGFQELNVALGGSLHQCVHQVPGLHDHREPAEQPVSVQYAARQPLQVLAGGVLDAAGLPARCQVNSIHGQGIDRLAAALRVEAVADDGLIEAVSVRDARFALGVQFHPEWQVKAHPHYLAIFQAFGAACRQRAAQRIQGICA